MNVNRHWIVTADNRRASLFSCRKTPGGELNVEHVRTLENAHENEHEHHRPSSLGGAERRGTKTRAVGSAAPHSASPGHAVDEEQRRFAHEVAGWLDRASKELSVEGVAVFAAPHLLGLLRSQKGKIGATTELLEGELTHLRPHELAEHPAVRAAVEAPAAPKGGGKR